MTKLLIFNYLSLLSTFIFAQNSIRDTIQIEGITKNAINNNSNIGKTVLSNETISSKEIKNTSNQNIFDAIMKNTSGIFMTERNIMGFGVSTGSAGNISIRGLGGINNNQISMLTDGIPDNMGLFGHYITDNFNKSDFQSVEIKKGSAAILYGGNAIGGSINFINKKSDKIGYQGEIGLMGGSYGTHYFYLQNENTTKNNSLNVNLNFKRTDGHRQNSYFEMYEFSITDNYTIDKNWQIKLNSSFNKFKFQDPGKNTDNIAGPKYDITRTRSSIQLQNNYEYINGKTSIFYNYGIHDISDGWYSRDYVSGVKTIQTLNFNETNQLIIGYDFILNGGKGSPIINSIFKISDYNDIWIRQYTNSGYMLYSLKLFSIWQTEAGIRYDYNKTFGWNILPYISTSLNIENLKLFASATRGLRNPTIKEMFLFPVANNNLKTEKVNTFEAGFSYNKVFQKTINFSLEFNTFYLSGKDIIINQSAAPFQYQNIGKIENKGFELQLLVKLRDFIEYSHNYTYIDMEYKMPYTPENNLNMSLSLNLYKFRFETNLNIIENLYSISNNKNNTIEKIEDKYTTLNANLEYNMNSRIKLYINAKNLLNTDYSINFGYPMVRRSFFSGVKIKI